MGIFCLLLSTSFTRHLSHCMIALSVFRHLNTASPWACVCAQSFSCVQLFATPWTVACQASLSMEFSRKEYWSGLPFPTPEDPPDPGIEPKRLCVLHCQVGSLLLRDRGSPFACTAQWLSHLPSSPSHTLFRGWHTLNSQWMTYIVYKVSFPWNVSSCCI